jgi:hypothetical protein
MKRNSFLKISSLAVASLFAPVIWEKLRAASAISNDGADRGSSLWAGEEKIKLGDYFKTDRQEVFTLLEKILQNCVFTKIMEPRGTLERRWIMPGGYVGQWIWDTMFVTDLLSIFKDQEVLLREVFQNYRDFQSRWNKVSPEYRHDMVACMIEPDNQNWINYPAYSQIPILAWGLEQIYLRNHDLTIVQENLESIEKFHEWYWRERDVTHVGMVSVGSYSEDIQHARFETFDFDGTLDQLKLTRHPSRNSDHEGNWYGDILVVGNTSYLVQAEKSLVRLARILGNEAMAKRREARIRKSIKAMRKYMWDEEAGCFLAVHRDTLKKIRETSIGCWMPLLAGIPTKAMAKRMAGILASEAWLTPVPVATMPQNDPRYTPGGFWRGDAWPPSTYQIAKGLKAYGYDDLAATIADKMIANALKNGVNERYDSQTGLGLGVEYLGMSCSLITMMLEGITKEHILQLRQLRSDPVILLDPGGVYLRFRSPVEDDL